MKTHCSIFSVLAVVSLFAAGCSSARDVEVTGQVAAPATGAVHIDFYDQPTGGNKLVKSLDQDKPGPFTATVAVEGEKVRVIAIGDVNKNSKCDAGESWGEAFATIKDGKTEAITLMLVAAPCPTITVAAN